MAAEFNPPRPLKPIELPKFDSLTYTAWAFQCRSLLELANVWNIVTGDEPRPAPLAAGTANARAAQQARIDYWNSRDKQARSSLIKAVDSKQVAKFYNTPTAQGIWTRLKNEYGQPDQSKFIKYLNTLTSLSPPDFKSLEDYITRFEEVITECTYHADGNFLPPRQINLMFLGSLGNTWSHFRRSIADRIGNLSLPEVFALVRTADTDQDLWQETIASLNSDSTLRAFQTNVPTLESRLITLESRISDGSNNRQLNRGRFNGQSKGYRPGGYRGQAGSHGQGGSRGQGRYRGHKGQGRSNGIGKKYDKPINSELLCHIPKYDPKQWCQNCKIRGHDVSFCLKRILKNGELRNNHYSGNSGDSNYLPSYDFTANVTRFVAHSTQLSSPKSDSTIWIVDSASNAIITPFKERLQNYVTFTYFKEVKGCGGLVVNAVGSGSITLQDASGNRYTFTNAVYVPDATDNILSLMLLRIHGLTFNFLDEMDPDIDPASGAFLISARKTNFTLRGHAVDNILYLAEGSTRLPPTVNLIQSHSSGSAVKYL